MTLGTRWLREPSQLPATPCPNVGSKVCTISKTANIYLALKQIANFLVFEAMLNRSRAAIRLTLPAGDPTHATQVVKANAGDSLRMRGVPLAGEALGLGGLGGEMSWRDSNLPLLC